MESYLVVKDGIVVDFRDYDEVDVPQNDGFQYILRVKDNDGMLPIVNVGDSV